MNNKMHVIESFHHGHSINAYELFGAHITFEEKHGVRFTVWAPHATSVQVMGDFNEWGRKPIIMDRISYEIFSVFVPDVKEGAYYRYNVEGSDGSWQQKSDPYAFFSEVRPGTNSIVYDINQYSWKDSKWMNARTKNFDSALNIYEVHVGAWMFKDEHVMSYDNLIDTLIPYVKENGFTHVEFMPLNEHPFDGSWGYQASGYFSCTSRYGTPKQFMNFVNAAHKANIGVIMDFVPVHFVKDHHGLAYFDGQPCYEYPQLENALSQWGTLNFDLWKEEVRSFLMSAAAFWFDVYHIDGIRMDAVSNLIYWNGDKNRGVNEGALAFIRRMNYYLSQKYPTTMLIAEDSSDFPKVCDDTVYMGLGFDYKWDLGWMNDTLKYYSIDPIYRKYKHNTITFSMAYYYSEKFLLPLSHDEVVHGKGTIVDKMWGSYDQKFAQVKNLYLYMYTHPGKKLNFMGNEIAMFREFDEHKEMDWFLLKYPRHDVFNQFFKDLSLLYLKSPALCAKDYDPFCFQWIDADNADQSIYSYIREDEQHLYVIVLNMLEQSYDSYRIGVPLLGKYYEKLNSDHECYEGNNKINSKPINAKKIPAHRHPYSIEISIGSFAAMILKVKKSGGNK